MPRTKTSVVSVRVNSTTKATFERYCKQRELSATAGFEKLVYENNSESDTQNARDVTTHPTFQEIEAMVSND